MEKKDATKHLCRASRKALVWQTGGIISLNGGRFPIQLSSVTETRCGSNSRKLESARAKWLPRLNSHGRNSLCLLRPNNDQENRHESAVGLSMVSRYLLEFPPRPFPPR